MAQTVVFSASACHSAGFGALTLLAHPLRLAGLGSQSGGPLRAWVFCTPAAVPVGGRGLLQGPLWPPQSWLSSSRQGCAPAGLPRSLDVCVRSRHPRGPRVASTRRLPLTAPAWLAFSLTAAAGGESWHHPVNCGAKQASRWDRRGPGSQPPSRALLDTILFQRGRRARPTCRVSSPARPTCGQLPLWPCRPVVRGGHFSVHIHPWGAPRGRSARAQPLPPFPEHVTPRRARPLRGTTDVGDTVVRGSSAFSALRPPEWKPERWRQRPRQDPAGNLHPVSGALRAGLELGWGTGQEATPILS